MTWCIYQKLVKNKKNFVPKSAMFLFDQIFFLQVNGLQYHTDCLRLVGYFINIELNYDVHPLTHTS